MRKVSRAEELRWKRQYLAGKSCCFISKMSGFNEVVVWQHLKNLGVKIRSLSESHRKFSDSQIRKVVSYLRQKMTARQIRRRLSIDPSTIWRIGKKHGVNPGRWQPRRCRLNQDAFSNESPERNYWIGFLMADGCVHPTHSQTVIAVTLAHRDAGHLKKFRKFVGSTHCIHLCVHATGARLAKFSFSSSRVARDLKRFGVVPRKSHTARVKLLSGCRHFWRGAVDGDGWVYMKNGKATIGLCGSHQLVSQFFRYARRHAKFQARVRHSGNIFAIAVNGRSAVKLIRHLWQRNATSLRRKQLVVDKIIGSRRPRL
jgi:hypothetical protein